MGSRPRHSSHPSPGASRGGGSVARVLLRMGRCDGGQAFGEVSARRGVRYTTKRREALSRFLDDGRLEIDNNIAENAIRCIALGRKNYLFAGADSGGDRA